MRLPFKLSSKLSIKKLTPLICTLSLCIFLSTSYSASAAPPVRVSIATGTGSGIEQAIVDRITASLADDGNIVVSTVNPDWYVTCNIAENVDANTGSIRYNGQVLVKTRDGQVLNTVAVQKYNQDFSTSGTFGGGFGGINKKLVDNAAREVINSAAARVVNPIKQAAILEMEARDRIIQAQTLADQDLYDDALSLLRPITPDTPHFKGVRALIVELEMEQDAFNRMTDAQARAKQGKLGEAINLAKDINIKSKRYKASRVKIASWRAQLAKRRTK